MSGYLYKKTRDDRWQKRWFETNGVYLTYYKSRKMEKLLAAEKPDPARRARFVARFNHGYRSYEATYMTCTPSATEAIRRYVKEGETLSRELANQYGD